jgi:hypothetical protein
MLVTHRCYMRCYSECLSDCCLAPIQQFYFFSTKHVALRRKIKDWLARYQNNVSEWNDMSTRGLLFQSASTMKSQLSVLI